MFMDLKFSTDGNKEKWYSLRFAFAGVSGKPPCGTAKDCEGNLYRIPRKGSPSDTLSEQS